MKKSLLVAAALAPVALTVVTGCSEGFFATPVEKTYDYTGFTQVEVSAAFRYEIKKSDTYSVVVSARPADVDELDIRLEGNTLKIGRKPTIGANGVVTAKISMPGLQALSVSGASSGTASGFASESPCAIVLSGASKLDMDLQSEDVDLHVSGASRVTGSLTASRLNAEVSGASHCGIKGSAPSAVLKIGGASDWNAPDLAHQNANVVVSGASKATINASSTLTLDVSGASTVNYLGNPKIDENVTGSSSVHHK